MSEGKIKTVLESFQRMVDTYSQRPAVIKMNDATLHKLDAEVKERIYTRPNVENFAPSFMGIPIEIDPEAMDGMIYLLPVEE